MPYRLSFHTLIAQLRVYTSLGFIVKICFQIYVEFEKLQEKKYEEKLCNVTFVLTPVFAKYSAFDK